MTNRILLAANNGTANARSAHSADAMSWATSTTNTFNNGSGAEWAALAYAPEIATAVQLINGSFGGNPTAGDAMYSLDQGATWSFTNIGQRNSWCGVAWSPLLGLFAALSSDGTNRVATSPDGITWTLQTAASASSWNGICWSEDLALFCAVGSGGAIMTSPDGAAWTSRTAAVSKNLWRVVWCGGTVQKFAAVATSAGGSDEVQHSVDGSTWIAESFSAGYSWANIGWSPDLGQCIVTGGNTGIIYHSSDLSSWTSTTTGLGGDPYQGICWSIFLQLWVLSGGTSGNAVATSADGVSWTAQTGIVSGGAGWVTAVAIEDAPGDGGAASSDEAASSDHQHDVTWNPADKTSTVTLSNNNLTAQTNGVAASAGVRATLAHNSGKKYFEIHIDQIDGGNQFQLFGIGPNDIDLATDFSNVYGGTKPGGSFIQMGFHDGGGHFEMRDITIAFAVDFRTRECKFKVRVGNANYTGDWTGGGKFAKGFQFPTLLLTDSGIGQILKPTITGNFGAQSFLFDIPAGFAAWDGLQGAESGAETLFKGKIAVAGGSIPDTNQVIAYSADAINFAFGTNPTHTNGSAMDFNLAANSKLFVGVANSSSDAARAAVYSLDGQVWTPSTAAENNTWNGVCYAPEIPLFVAVASDGTHRVMTSPDGLPGNWTVQTAAVARAWKSVCWSPELHLFVAVAGDGGGLTDTIMTSPDGVTWTSRTSPFDRQWENVIWVSTYGEIPSSGSASVPTGLFIATPIGATGGNPDYATSPDGINWTARTTGTASAGFYMAAYSVDTGRTVAVANDYVCFTDDGFNWTGKVTIAGSPSLHGVIWSRVGQCFIAASTSGELYFSLDGTDWTELSEPGVRSWHSLAEKLDHTETPSSALDSFLIEHPSSSFAGSSAPASSEPASSAGGGGSSAPASSEPASSTELASSTLEALSSEAAEAASSEFQSDIKDEIPPPVQVVVTLSS